jgi:hypothetical protein
MAGGKWKMKDVYTSEFFRNRISHGRSVNHEEKEVAFFIRCSFPDSWLVTTTQIEGAGARLRA